MSVRWTGLRELSKVLQAAGDDVRGPAMAIVRDETEQAARDIAAALPSKTGTLRSRIRTRYPSSRRLVGIVSSAAPHSHLYEFGTKTRRTRAGSNRGRMPANPVTPRVAKIRRARMFRRLIDMVKAMGLFQVSGDL